VDFTISAFAGALGSLLGLGGGVSEGDLVGDLGVTGSGLNEELSLSEHSGGFASSKSSSSGLSDAHSSESHHG